jgi:hypothetical protein
VSVESRKVVEVPISAEGPIPGTMADGENAACSMSWK